LRLGYESVVRVRTEANFHADPYGATHAAALSSVRIEVPAQLSLFLFEWPLPPVIIAGRHRWKRPARWDIFLLALPRRTGRCLRPVLRHDGGFRGPRFLFLRCRRSLSLTVQRAIRARHENCPARCDAW
jgi:hypothetical protein